MSEREMVVGNKMRKLLCNPKYKYEMIRNINIDSYMHFSYVDDRKRIVTVCKDFIVILS